MPRPHFPVQGGSRRPVSNPSSLSAGGAANPSASDANDRPGKNSVQSLEAEITRLRQELERARHGQGGPRYSVWTAVAFVAVALAFALLALLRHG